MSDARLIKRIADFGTPEGTDDLEEPGDYERWAKQIIRIVRRSDRRRRPKPTCDICGRPAEDCHYCPRHAP